MSMHAIDTGDELKSLRSTDRALHTAEQGLGAGERNVDSLTNSYTVVRQECNCSILSKTTATVVGGGVAGDTHLMNLIIHTALTGTLVIGGFADTDGTAQSFTLPAGAVGQYDFKGAINAAGALTFTASNAADDNKVAILWRPV